MNTTNSPPRKAKNPNGFNDPYEDIDKWHRTRTTIDVSDEAISAIRSVYPKKGVVQTTINLLIEKLKDELTRCQLKSYDPERYEIAIAQCEIRLGGFNYERNNTKRQPRSQPRAST